MVSDWRIQTRKTLDKVKFQFIEWIEMFTEKFVRSLEINEQKKSSYDLDESDRQQKANLQIIKDERTEILKI